jgi:hypothetical protein
MIRDYKDFKPIKVGGQISIFLGLLIFLTYFSIFREPDLNSSFDIFAWANICWYLLMGIGVLQQRIWGYYMLKSFLYVLAIGFPIGTYIGLKSLKYLKEKEIKEFFVGKALDL